MHSASSEVVPFSEAIAHPGDPLTQHLSRVAQVAWQSLAPASPSARRVGLFAALCHDVGKATHFFQVDRLQKQIRSERTTHSMLGAIWTWWASEQALSLRERLSATVAVLRHHGRLKRTWTEELGTVLFEARNGRVVREQLAAMDVRGASAFLREALTSFEGVTGIPEPIESADQLLACLPRSTLPMKRLVGELEDAVDFLAGFGALVAADRVDTALEGGAIARVALPADAVTQFKAERFGEPRSDLNRRREAISQAVEAAWIAQADQRLFTLTSPTGSGKTLAVLNAALRRREAGSGEGAFPRIIYCLPFTSVIDQNERVFASVLQNAGVDTTSDVLLKHHHLSEKGFRTAGQDEYEEDGAGRLLTESWQSELVVSTFHQLLHTLLSVRTRNLQRAGQLAGALVILDEVQAIPLRYWDTIGRLLATTGSRLNTSFVLCTATRPLIVPPDRAVELLPDNVEHFEAMTRTRLLCHHQEPLSLVSFGDQLSQHMLGVGPCPPPPPRSNLVILNRKQAVADLYELLRSRLSGFTVRALSTNLTPADRLERIREIRGALASGERLVVVSTQLVEAGVDFSFHEVHRDLAPLDSIIQSAGRCNRSGEGDTGLVHLWQLVDSSPKAPELWRHVYDGLLIDATVESLGNATEIAESEFLELSERYFSACVSRAESSPVHELLAAGKFEEIPKIFQLIEQRPSQPYFVCRTEEDERLWGIYRRWRDDPSPEARKSFRSAEQAFMEQVVEVYSRKPADEVIRVGTSCYHPELGLSNPGET